MQSAVHRDKGAEVVMESFVWPVDTVGITFFGDSSSETANFISVWGDIKDAASGWGIT